MKIAIIVAGVVTGTYSHNPDLCTVVGVVGAEVPVPDDSPVATGWTYTDGEFAPPARTINADYVRSKLLLTDRVKWDAGKIDELVTVKTEFATPKTMSEAFELLDFLVDNSVISQTSMDRVLA